jgi:hypothetical protein
LTFRVITENDMFHNGKSWPINRAWLEN